MYLFIIAHPNLTQTQILTIKLTPNLTQTLILTLEKPTEKTWMNISVFGFNLI